MNVISTGSSTSASYNGDGVASDASSLSCEAKPAMVTTKKSNSDDEAPTSTPAYRDFSHVPEEGDAASGLVNVKRTLPEKEGKKEYAMNSTLKATLKSVAFLTH